MADILLERRRRPPSRVLEPLIDWSWFVSLLGAWVAITILMHSLWPDEKTLAVVTLSVAVFGGYYVTWRLLGSETVAVEADTLRIVCKASVFSQSTAIPVLDIAKVRVRNPGRREVQSKAIVPASATVVVEDKDGRPLSCGFALSADEAQVLAERMRLVVDQKRRRTSA